MSTDKVYGQAVSLSIDIQRAIFACMDVKKVEFTVAGVALDGESDAPTVLMRDISGMFLITVPVGAFEASAIIIELEGLHPPRPLTHDLLAGFLRRHRFTLRSFELYERLEDGFLGRIRYRKGLKTFSMEVRPSDGIALALRLGSPILANPDLAERIVGELEQTHPIFHPEDSVLFLDHRGTELRA